MILFGFPFEYYQGRLGEVNLKFFCADSPSYIELLLNIAMPLGAFFSSFIPLPLNWALTSSR